MLQHVVKQSMIPIGICSMSEKQGGQHEIGLKPVQAAANFFTTLTVDGQNRDLVRTKHLAWGGSGRWRLSDSPTRIYAG